MLVNSYKPKDFASFLFGHNMFRSTFDAMIKYMFFFGACFFYYFTLNDRSIRNQARDGNIIIVATKTLRLQPNCSKMNAILTSFQRNFVSLFHSILIYNEVLHSTFSMQIKISALFLVLLLPPTFSKLNKFYIQPKVFFFIVVVCFLLLLLLLF